MLPKEIRQLREKLGMTVQEFANTLGCSEASVYRWESGKREPYRANRRELINLQKKSDKKGGHDED